MEFATNRSARRSGCVMWAAFTLLVGLLGCLLSPYPYFGGKESAKATATLSDVKQIATACLVYSEDNDGGWPITTINGSKTALGWPGRLNLKASGDEFHRDPASLLVAPVDVPRYGDSDDAFADARPRDPRENFPISFALNANVATAQPISKVAAPENVILVFEVEGARAPRGAVDARCEAERLSPVGDGTPGGLRDTLRPHLPTKARYATGLLAAPWDIGPRRPEGAVFALVDGHARKATPERLAELGRNWTFRMR